MEVVSIEDRVYVVCEVSEIGAIHGYGMGVICYLMTEFLGLPSIMTAQASWRRSRAAFGHTFLRWRRVFLPSTISWARIFLILPCLHIRSSLA